MQGFVVSIVIDADRVGARSCHTVGWPPAWPRRVLWCVDLDTKLAAKYIRVWRSSDVRCSRMKEGQHSDASEERGYWHGRLRILGASLRPLGKSPEVH